MIGLGADWVERTLEKLGPDQRDVLVMRIVADLRLVPTATLHVRAPAGGNGGSHSGGGPSATANPNGQGPTGGNPPANPGGSGTEHAAP